MRLVVCVICASAALAQTPISGRLTDGNGRGIVGQQVGLGPGRQATTDSTGAFTIDAETNVGAELSLSDPGGRSNGKLVGVVAVSGEYRLSLGNIVFETGAHDHPGGRVVGPIAVEAIGAPAKMPHVAAVFCGSTGATVIHGDGKVVAVPLLTDQVGCGATRIAYNGGAVGWLAQSDFCCTSYSIGLALVVYRPGKPIRQFTGDGRAIFEWRFLAGEKHVGFYQDFLHGTLSSHYESRDIETGRLVAEWNSDSPGKRPVWVRLIGN
jgi:hypothetical protein